MNVTKTGSSSGQFPQDIGSAPVPKRGQNNNAHGTDLPSRASSWSLPAPRQEAIDRQLRKDGDLLPLALAAAEIDYGAKALASGASRLARAALEGTAKVVSSRGGKRLGAALGTAARHMDKVHAKALAAKESQGTKLLGMNYDYAVMSHAEARDKEYRLRTKQAKTGDAPDPKLEARIDRALRKQERAEHAIEGHRGQAAQKLLRTSAQESGTVPTQTQTGPQPANRKT
jgi:hypothetical protein